MFSNEIAAACALLSLGGRRARIEKLRHGGDKLSGCEWLCQHDAVRDALGRPIFGFVSAHINDGKVGVDFSSVSCDLPPVELSRLQIDVGDKRSVFAVGSIKQLDGIFARRSYCSLEPTLAQALFDKVLHELIVFNDQDN